MRPHIESGAKMLVNSTCPHDCPSTCALQVDKISDTKIGKVRGALDNTYTAGVICSKVARYRERIHNPNRILKPMRRIGNKGSGKMAAITWEEALEEICDKFIKIEQQYGSEAIWPYYYAGTMGLVMRDGINRLRHVKRYSGEHQTICTNQAFNGYLAGAGKMLGVDPAEIKESDNVIIWGTNAAVTQINVMSHANEARRTRNANIIVIDSYRNATAKQADLFLCVKPGTDGALACGVMHYLVKNNLHDIEYLKTFTDFNDDFMVHLEKKNIEWASDITGVEKTDIEQFAKLLGNKPRNYFRLGYGFTRQKNGASNMHAVASLPAILGSWKYKGGGALMNNGSIYHWDKTLIEGLDCVDPQIRLLDQSRIGEVLNGNKDALHAGPPVMAMLIQNTNPMSVAPDLNSVKKGFLRNDLFVVVHEQFMTDTAKMADIVLPATMFLEHDDLYQSGGHNHIQLGPKIIEAPGDCKSNHTLICDLANKLGLNHRGFNMTSEEIINETLIKSGWGTLDNLKKRKWINAQPSFKESHFLDGFAHNDKLWHFKANWHALGKTQFVSERNIAELPEYPDHLDINEKPNDEYPFKLITPPARHFLNSSFANTSTSVQREQMPKLLINPEDAKKHGITCGSKVIIFNEQGEIDLTAEFQSSLSEGLLVAESIWHNSNFKNNLGINVLVSSKPIGVDGGVPFHDIKVGIKLDSN